MVFTFPFPELKDAAVGFSIDGIDLRALLQAVELPYATREGEPSMAGSYSGLMASAVLPPSQHFLGVPALKGLGGTVILGCVCGEPGCWPLMADVTVADSNIKWSDFRQPHRTKGRRKWSYKGFGPFVFGKVEYEKALRNPARLQEDPWGS